MANEYGTQLSAATQVALSKVKLDRDTRGELNPGTYDVDELVWLKGQIKVGEPFESVASGKVPWQKLFIIAVSKLNQATMEATIDQCVAALEGGIDDDVYDKAVERTEEAMSSVADAVTKVFAGKVTGDVQALPCSCQPNIRQLFSLIRNGGDVVQYLLQPHNLHEPVCSGK